MNGYHGYWPLNLYSVNPAFGTEQDFQDLLGAISDDGLLVMLDMVFNHMGYGSTYPSFNYYYNPFNQAPFFHDCENCLSDCSVPETLPNVMNEETYLQMWKCQLQRLPDLDHKNATVTEGFINWIKYVKGRYLVDAFRYDAMPFISPDFFSLVRNVSEVFGLGEIYLDNSSNGTYQIIDRYMGVGKTLLGSVELDGNQGTFSQLDYQFYFAVMKCFAGASCCNGSPAVGCQQISYVRNRYREMGVNQKLMGRFLESADVPRFLAQNNNTIALRNALALVFFGEGIPISWQGLEQGMCT
jgi:alpha-amylase